jgi:hypothetical protein
LREAIFSPEMIWEAVHNVGAANLKDFLPYRVDLICGISKMLMYLKEYLEFFIWTRSWKASQQQNNLKRLGSYLNRLNKLTIFHTFILSNFNFCPLAWHFCTNKNSKKLEKVQERALRFVYEDYNSSYEV